MNRIANIVIVGLLFLFIGQWLAGNSATTINSNEWTYSEFMSQVTAGRVSNVILDESQSLITGDAGNGQQFKVVMPNNDARLIDTLVDRNINFSVKEPETGSIWLSILINILPILLSLIHI